MMCMNNLINNDNNMNDKSEINNADMSNNVNCQINSKEKQVTFEPLVIRIEYEMQVRTGSYNMPMLPLNYSELLEPILTQAFLTQPFLGNIIISQQQIDLIHSLALDAISGIHNYSIQNEYVLSDFYCDILVLDIVILLRNWKEENEDNLDTNNIFWEFICKQYILPYNDNFGGSLAYKSFRHAIRTSLLRHKRLFAKSGQKYYTSMLVHALAPKIKFYALFEQIFSFYAKSLQYQYINSDPAFRAFAYAMKRRFKDEYLFENENMYIKSVQSSSAIKTLFIQCSEYMGVFVDYVVFNIDKLVATGYINENSYLDTLLNNWYKNRSNEDRINAVRERTKSSNERVVIEFSNIRLRYHYEKERIFLMIPPIRLGEESEYKPIITIYRYIGDKIPYKEKLRYYGDNFCITSSKTFISLDDILLENSESINLRVVISYAGENIYDSETKLYRNAIAFCSDGTEITKKPIMEYTNIVVTTRANISGDDTSPDCSAISFGKFYLYRILFDENTYITVNGNNLFPIEQNTSGLVINKSIAPASYCKFMLNQKEYDIYANQITLIITSENINFEKQYRLTIDGEVYPLAKYYMDTFTSCKIDLPDGKDVHELQIIDNATHKLIYTLFYLIIYKFIIKFNGFYYKGYNKNGFVIILDNNGIVNKYTYKLLHDNETMIIPYNNGKLSIDVPKLCCRLNGEILPTNKIKNIWYQEIPMSALLEVDVPRGYNCKLSIGKRIFNSNNMEIGNEIRIKHDANIENTSVIIDKKNETQKIITLFNIYYKPTFKSSPLVLNNGKVSWSIINNYIGDTKCVFKISIIKNSVIIKQYNLGYKNEDIMNNNILDGGQYEYKIYWKKGSIITENEIIFKGQFIIGNLIKYKFDNHVIVITDLVINNKKYKLNQNFGIINNIHYLPQNDHDRNDIKYVCYEGYIQNKINDKISLNEIKKMFWIINDCNITFYDHRNEINNNSNQIIDIDELFNEHIDDRLIRLKSKILKILQQDNTTLTKKIDYHIIMKYKLKNNITLKLINAKIYYTLNDLSYIHRIMEPYFDLKSMELIDRMLICTKIINILNINNYSSRNYLIDKILQSFNLIEIINNIHPNYFIYKTINQSEINNV